MYGLPSKKCTFNQTFLFANIIWRKKTMSNLVISSVKAPLEFSLDEIERSAVDALLILHGKRCAQSRNNWLCRENEKLLNHCVVSVFILFLNLLNFNFI